MESPCHLGTELLKVAKPETYDENFNMLCEACQANIINRYGLWAHQVCKACGAVYDMDGALVEVPQPTEQPPDGVTLGHGQSESDEISGKLQHGDSGAHAAVPAGNLPNTDVQPVDAATQRNIENMERNAAGIPNPMDAAPAKPAVDEPNPKLDDKERKKGK